MKPQLVLLGAPGSGKGTQAERLVAEIGYKHVSTGDLLRAEIKSGSELGKRIAEIINKGHLVDDETVQEMLCKNCDLENSSYIFDGYPRNTEQAKALDDILKESTAVAVYFDIDLEVIVERIINRRSCESCGAIYNLKFNAPKDSTKCDKCGGGLTHRKDDNEEVVRSRMEVFKKQTFPVLDYYEQQGILRRVDASKAPVEIFEDIKKIVL